jgi:hypothetical protein
MPIRTDSTPRGHRHRRRHRVTLDQPDRRALERAGWRTILEYRENHERGSDGTLLAVEPRWIAEAEHRSDRVLVASVTASTVEEAWALLREVTASRR